MKRLFIGFILLSISNHLFASDNLEFFLVSQPDTIKIITLHYSDSLPDSSAYINIDYPQIKDFENKAVEEKVNNFFKDEFEQSILWYDEIAADTSEVDSFEFNFSYSFETGFNVEYNSNKFLSISLDHYQYTGGAHGNFYSSGYNIDMKTGKVLPLSDIINNDSFDILSYECEQAILDSFQVNSLTEAGLFDDEISVPPDQDYYIIPGALVLQFDPYEIGPFSMGELNVEIPFNKIKDILKENLPFPTN